MPRMVYSKSALQAIGEKFKVDNHFSAEEQRKFDIIEAGGITPLKRAVANDYSETTVASSTVGANGVHNNNNNNNNNNVLPGDHSNHHNGGNNNSLNNRDHMNHNNGRDNNNNNNNGGNRNNNSNNNNRRAMNDRFMPPSRSMRGGNRDTEAFEAGYRYELEMSEAHRRQLKATMETEDRKRREDQFKAASSSAKPSDTEERKESEEVEQLLAGMAAAEGGAAMPSRKSRFFQGNESAGGAGGSGSGAGATTSNGPTSSSEADSIWGTSATAGGRSVVPQRLDPASSRMMMNMNMVDQKDIHVGSVANLPPAMSMTAASTHMTPTAGHLQGGAVNGSNTGGGHMNQVAHLFAGGSSSTAHLTMAGSSSAAAATGGTAAAGTSQAVPGVATKRLWHAQDLENFLATRKEAKAPSTGDGKYVIASDLESALLEKARQQNQQNQPQPQQQQQHSSLQQSNQSSGGMAPTSTFAQNSAALGLSLQAQQHALQNQHHQQQQQQAVAAAAAAAANMRYAQQHPQQQWGRMAPPTAGAKLPANAMAGKMPMGPGGAAASPYGILHGLQGGAAGGLSYPLQQAVAPQPHPHSHHAQQQPQPVMYLAPGIPSFSTSANAGYVYPHQHPQPH